MIEMRFFVRIRGTLTPPPNILTPVANMPLQIRKLLNLSMNNLFFFVQNYNAAPVTESETARAMPINAHS